MENYNDVIMCVAKKDNYLWSYAPIKFLYLLMFQSGLFKVFTIRVGIQHDVRIVDGKKSCLRQTGKEFTVCESKLVPNPTEIAEVRE